jgi:hypothetical protein
VIGLLGEDGVKITEKVVLYRNDSRESSLMGGMSVKASSLPDSRQTEGNCGGYMLQRQLIPDDQKGVLKCAKKSQETWRAKTQALQPPSECDFWKMDNIKTFAALTV